MRNYTNLLLTSLLVFSCFFIPGCSTLEKQTSEQQFQSIVFGKTGGFSNINKAYTIVRRVGRSAVKTREIIRSAMKSSKPGKDFYLEANPRAIFQLKDKGISMLNDPDGPEKPIFIERLGDAVFQEP